MKKKNDDMTIEQKVNLLLKTLISSTIFLSVISLSSLVLISVLYPQPLSEFILLIAIILAMSIIATLRKYTKM